MVQSMTGFVSQTFDLAVGSETVTITLHIKSLNARFFEGSCKLPHALAHLEPAIIKKLREKLLRGTVQCSMYVSSPVLLGNKPVVSKSAIQGYLEAAQTIEQEYTTSHAIATTIDINTLLTLPHVIEFAENPVSQESMQIILDNLDTQIDRLVAERMREGAELAVDLNKRLADLASMVAQIKERSVEVFATKKEKLLADIKELVAQSTMEAQEHHLQMVYGQLERLDITEEIVRLTAHIANAQQIMVSGKAELGKKLDFTFQEMFREINTIGAKCADSALSNLAIAAKVELEKSREQIQNIV